MRVLHVIRNLNDGGMERVVADLVAAMGRRQEIEPHVLSLEPGGRFADILRGHAEIHVAQRGTKLSLLRPARLAADIARIAPDIVHAHSGTWFKTARAARMAGTQCVVYTEHGRQFPDPLLNRVLDGAAAQLTDSVVVVSTALREHMIRRLRVPETKTRVIVNGIDVEAVRAEGSMSDATTREAHVVTFVAVGRLEAVKGLSLLVDVVQQWPASAPECRVLIAGEGSQRDELKRRVEMAGLSDRIRFLGWVQDPVRLIKAADVYLLPSYSEGTSISLLEAMASGLPPVASAVGGNPEVLGPELTEWLFPSGDIAGLRDRMVELAASADLRALVGSRARERVEQAYSLRAMVDAYLAVYRHLLLNRSR